MKDLTTITSRINSFPFFYEMSSSKNFKQQAQEMRLLRKEIEELSIKELQHVKSNLTADLAHVVRYFKPFEGLPETKKSYRSEIMKNAWAYFKDQLFESFGEALRAAWRRYNLINSLRKGIVFFSYIKKDGSERKAIGTLSNDNYSYERKTDKQDQRADLLKYYDIEKQGFRSARVENLLAA